MRRRLYSLAVAFALPFAVSGCPMTDDYYLLPSGAASGTTSQAGAGGSVSGSGNGGTDVLPQGAEGGVGSSGGGAGAALGGSPTMGGSDAGEAGESAAGGPSEACIPSIERCNGRDDNCDGFSDEFFACVSNCVGFVLPEAPDHGYMFCNSTRRGSWETANMACAAQQMRLVWLESAAENEAIARKLDELGADLEILIGATDQGSEGSWLWFGGEQFWTGDEDGDPVSGLYNSWANGSPNNNNNEDCALINAMNGGWSDRSCTASYPYLCEQPD
jgi:hypothetical protein